MHQQSQTVRSGARITTSRRTTSFPSPQFSTSTRRLARVRASVMAARTRPGFCSCCRSSSKGRFITPSTSSIGMEGVNSGPLPGGFIINSTVYTTKIASLQCPSDNQSTYDMSGGSFQLPWQASKGNYGVNWGNLDYGQALSALGGQFVNYPQLWLQSPFGYSRTGNGPFNCRIAAITDGTSNTILASEILQGRNRRHPRRQCGSTTPGRVHS